MLKFYLTTVVIWMIIIYAMAQIFKEGIKEKGWIKEDKSTKKGRFSILFTLAAVPIIRLFVCVLFIYMCSHTPEQLEALKEKGADKKDK